MHRHHSASLLSLTCTAACTDDSERRSISALYKNSCMSGSLIIVIALSRQLQQVLFFLHLIYEAGRPISTWASSESTDSPHRHTGSMPRELSAYHRRMAATNRATILEAATELFLELGFDRTSLAQVAARAGVSKATLFKQFPTKAELFTAMVLRAGEAHGSESLQAPAGDFRSGLVVLGTAYVELLSRPRMAELIRAVITESARFPELREQTFDFGTLPVLRALRQFLEAANERGDAQVDDLDVASAQFLGMIATVVFWPRLVHGNWSLTDDETSRTVDEAARTIAARYGTSIRRPARGADRVNERAR